MNSFNAFFKPFDSKIYMLKSYCLNMIIFSDLSKKILVDGAR